MLYSYSSQNIRVIVLLNLMNFDANCSFIETFMIISMLINMSWTEVVQV